MQYNGFELNIIARVRTDFPTKFGIPRQSGLCDFLKAEIVFEQAYRNPESLRGLEGFSHLWLIWMFSDNVRDGFSPTVRPPRLGGNERVGVFASRSPFRPNPIGLSCVRLEGIEYTRDRGAVLHISGADIKDGTPVFDIKPYIPYTDSIPEALGGYASRFVNYRLAVEIPDCIKNSFPPEKLEALLQVLSNDPRPSYQNDAERVYGFFFADNEIRFTVDGETLHVVSIEKMKHSAVIAGGLSEKSVSSLASRGITVFEPEASEFLPSATTHHADMLFHILPDGSILAAKGQNRLASLLKGNGFDILGVRADISPVYPKDCALNAARVGNNIICSRDALSPVLLKYYCEHEYNIIDVKQGYSKCACAVVSDCAIITEDSPIAAKAEKSGIDVLLLKPGFVSLPGYEHGFIGGAAGLIDSSTLAFNGDITAHPQFSDIKAFLEKHGVNYLCITDEVLTDCGGILLLR